ncbi:MAG: long-chain fatty acid--CoA ligase [Bacteroidetes bacterium]|nr:long-chain fatty acid--CoA ligase [Bacteroidota bacterium]
MKDFTRLFDILKVQESKYPRHDCLNYKYDGVWRNYSTKEVNEIIDKVSKAFIGTGIKPNDKVAIISNNRPEWNFIDNGMMQAGIINVPIYPTISREEYEYIFNNAEIKMAFVADANLYDKIADIKSAVPTLDKIYSFDKISKCEHWEEFLKFGENVDFVEVENISKKIQPNDLATLIYTSGTTGKPKGVMLSHNNIVRNVKSVLSLLPVEKQHIALSFLPLCHIFERTVTYSYFTAGVGCYYAESLETISDDLKDVKPHFFSTVPRLLEKVYEKIVSKGMELTGFKKKLFFWALDLTDDYTEDFKPGLKFKIADKLIFSKWREALGGNVIGIVTGAAALQERLARVFSAAGIAIREGYGQTESSPVITVNRFEQGGFKFGTVGMTIPGVEIKIAENGEVLCKGPNVMLGYYKNQEETDKTVIDGWLHTGDVGEIIDGKFLKITDRVKSLFKTSGGKYVAPSVIEEKMKESRFIEQILVLGENKKFVSALIVPSFINLEEWCQKNAINYGDKSQIIKTPEVLSLLKKEVERINEHFSKVEKIKKFELLADEWSIDTGELTPTLKVKRKVVLEKYKNVIENIYNV